MTLACQLQFKKLLRNSAKVVDSCLSWIGRGMDVKDVTGSTWEKLKTYFFVQSLMAILIDKMRISEALFKKTTSHNLPPANKAAFGSYFSSPPTKMQKRIYKKDSYKQTLENQRY